MTDIQDILKELLPNLYKMFPNLKCFGLSRFFML